jgi:hypothetical protein
MPDEGHAASLVVDQWVSTGRTFNGKCPRATLGLRSLFFSNQRKSRRSYLTPAAWAKYTEVSRRMAIAPW